MRYRRLSYRYTLLLGGQPAALGSGVALGDERLKHLRVMVARPRWCPPMDVFETASGLHLTLELAGVDPETVEIVLYDDALVVEGDRRLLPTLEPTRGVYHAAAIRQGPFRAELPLPLAVDPDQVDAQYDNGLLRVTLRRATGGER